MCIYLALAPHCAWESSALPPRFSASRANNVSNGSVGRPKGLGWTGLPALVQCTLVNWMVDGPPMLRCAGE